MANKPLPPENVIREESEPPITEVEEPPTHNKQPVQVDIDDAQIEEPRDDAFGKPSEAAKTPERRKSA